MYEALIVADRPTLQWGEPAPVRLDCWKDGTRLKKLLKEGVQLLLALESSVGTERFGDGPG
jgi:hypothetical protein